MRSYIALGCIVFFTLFAVGMMLKVTHRSKPPQRVVSYGCYTWSDGFEQCSDPQGNAYLRRQAVADRHFGCTLAQQRANPEALARGECP